jgi:hypothetical protein
MKLGVPVLLPHQTDNRLVFTRMNAKHESWIVSLSEEDKMMIDEMINAHAGENNDETMRMNNYPHG